jgi:hypothetical protein
MASFLYVSAILCAVIGVLFAFPLVIAAIFIAGLGALVSNTRPQRPTAGYQPIAPSEPPKAEDIPVSMVETYRKALEQRQYRHNW